MIRRAGRTLLLIGSAGLLGAWQGCGRPSPEPAARACEPAGGELGPAADPARLAGEHHLVLVAAPGAAGGARVAGRLTLVPFSPPAVAPAGTPADPWYRHAGWTDLDAGRLGIDVPGDASSRDPVAPGVLVLDWSDDSGRHLLLRVGSEANRRDRLRFDGAYLALTVTTVGADGFAGRWESGGGERGTSRGHFCATPVPAGDPAAGG